MCRWGYGERRKEAYASEIPCWYDTASRISQLTHPMATGLLRVGPKPPEVISPIFLEPSSEKISVCARAGAFMPAMPTLSVAAAEQARSG